MMKVSTRGRYGMRAMVDLALHCGSSFVLIRDISERQEISALYLEQIFARLKLAGLVRSSRGPKGGFNLTRPPSEIRLIDIMRATEGSTASVECVDNAEICARAASCPTRIIWVELKRATDRVLESTSLKDLVELEIEQRERANLAEVAA